MVGLAKRGEGAMLNRRNTISHGIFHIGGEVIRRD
jgi:hypothetical protein